MLFNFFSFQVAFLCVALVGVLLKFSSGFVSSIVRWMVDTTGLADQQEKEIVDFVLENNSMLNLIISFLYSIVLVNIQRHR